MDERGFSLAETVRRMGEHLPKGERISRASISQYRTGRAIPRPHYLDALSLALGIEKSSLIVVPDSAPTPAAESSIGVAQPRQSRRSALRPANAGNNGAGPLEARGVIGIQDLGGEVHLKIDQRVSWDVALKILDALKRRTE
jgi:transcriptional regulator with XRE-family HTH domain